LPLKTPPTFQLGRSQILHRQTQRFEQSDLLRRAAALALPGQELAELGADVVGADDALCNGEKVVA